MALLTPVFKGGSGKLIPVSVAVAVPARFVRHPIERRFPVRFVALRALHFTVLSGQRVSRRGVLLLAVLRRFICSFVVATAAVATVRAR
jgi:hypothetical protein